MILTQSSSCAGVKLGNMYGSIFDAVSSRTVIPRAKIMSIMVIITVMPCCATSSRFSAR